MLVYSNYKGLHTALQARQLTTTGASLSTLLVSKCLQSNHVFLSQGLPSSAPFIVRPTHHFAFCIIPSTKDERSWSTLVEAASLGRNEKGKGNHRIPSRKNNLKLSGWGGRLMIKTPSILRRQETYHYNLFTASSRETSSVAPPQRTENFQSRINLLWKSLM